MVCKDAAVAPWASHVPLRNMLFSLHACYPGMALLTPAAMLQSSCRFELEEVTSRNLDFVGRFGRCKKTAHALGTPLVFKTRGISEASVQGCSGPEPREQVGPNHGRPAVREQ